MKQNKQSNWDEELRKAKNRVDEEFRKEQERVANQYREEMDRIRRIMSGNHDLWMKCQTK